MKKYLYSNSWKLYKAHSELFVEDLSYYANFCQGKVTLELFAGYGRVANYLYELGVDIECVELEERFSNCIILPSEKIHTLDVLDFRPNTLYERIIGAYNSFCLLTDEESVRRFFNLISDWLIPYGRASFSYYNHEYWRQSQGCVFKLGDDDIKYISDFDFSEISSNQAIWIDNYINLNSGEQYKHEYPVKIYKDDSDVIGFLENTNLRLVDKVIDYNIENISDPGWVEYVFEKVS